MAEIDLSLAGIIKAGDVAELRKHVLSLSKRELFLLYMRADIRKQPALVNAVRKQMDKLGFLIGL